MVTFHALRPTPPRPTGQFRSIMLFGLLKSQVMTIIGGLLGNIFWQYKYTCCFCQGRLYHPEPTAFTAQ